jgi:hypothetical protein
VKKITAISFIVLLLLVQYAKKMSFISCTFFYTTSTKDCGCEKMLPSVAQGSTDTPDAIVHNHIHIDDFVKHFNLNVVTGFVVLQKNKYLFYKSLLQQGISAGLFRPPNT